MKAIAKVKLSSIVATTMISVLSSASWGDEVMHYGRAGGAVGADRIQELRAVQRSYQAVQPQSEAKEWYGRAGGPIGVDAVAGVKPESASATQSMSPPKVYGRAGAPLPFGD